MAQPVNRPLSPSSHLSSSPSSLQTRLEKLLGNLGFPFSGVIGIEGRGVHLRKTAAPVGASLHETQVFNGYSVGKMFTAVAVMQLVEEGRLDLDLPIREYLEEKDLDLPLEEPYKQDKPSASDRAKFWAHPITLRHLLTHHSGLAMTAGRPEKFDEEAFDKVHAYSNYGYQLVAHIVGKRTKNSQAQEPLQRFYDHLNSRIFRVAGMTDYEKAPTPQNHVLEGEKFVPIQAAPVYPHGNGCWKTTVEDLLLFLKTLRVGKLLLKPSFDQMLEGRGLGFMVDKDRDGHLLGYGHPGAVPGGSAFAHTFCSDKEGPLDVVVLSNGPTGCEIKDFLEKSLAPSGQ